MVTRHGIFVLDIILYQIFCGIKWMLYEELNEYRELK